MTSSKVLFYEKSHKYSVRSWTEKSRFHPWRLVHVFRTWFLCWESNHQPSLFKKEQLIFCSGHFAFIRESVWRQTGHRETDRCDKKQRCVQPSGCCSESQQEQLTIKSSNESKRAAARQLTSISLKTSLNAPQWLQLLAVLRSRTKLWHPAPEISNWVVWLRVAEVEPLKSGC